MAGRPGTPTLFLCSLTLLASAAHATDRYVAPTGSRRGKGTKASPDASARSTPRRHHPQPSDYFPTEVAVLLSVLLHVSAFMAWQYRVPLGNFALFKPLPS